MALPEVRILQTLEHRCGYYPERMARNLVIDPNAEALDFIYDAVSHSGFRRAGNLVFRPHCRGCSDCRATRIDVAAFRPSRSQKRCRASNGDLRVSVEAARFDEQVFALYDRYLSARHPQGGMDNPAREDFEGFLLSSWARTFFLEVRDAEQLLAVAVCDRLATGISAVYTFFEPAAVDRGLGTFCILEQIRVAAAWDLPFVYLGYWLPDHPKMAYKTSFRPIEVFDEGRWRPIGRDTAVKAGKRDQ